MRGRMSQDKDNEEDKGERERTDTRGDEATNQVNLRYDLVHGPPLN